MSRSCGFHATIQNKRIELFRADSTTHRNRSFHMHRYFLSSFRHVSMHVVLFEITCALRSAFDRQMRGVAVVKVALQIPSLKR